MKKIIAPVALAFALSRAQAPRLSNLPRPHRPTAAATAPAAATTRTAMKKIFLVLALAFDFTTGMAIVTLVAHTDQAMADGGSCASC